MKAIPITQALSEVLHREKDNSYQAIFKSTAVTQRNIILNHCTQ